MEIVNIDDIPKGPYKTPENLIHLFVAGQKMEAICRKSGGMGLAASQVGLPWRFFVYWSNYPSFPARFCYLFDCEYSAKIDRKFPSIEGCLSLPGRQYELERYNEISVSGKRLIFGEESLSLEDFAEVFVGLPSVVLQHEIDHDHGRERMIDRIGKPIHLSLAWSGGQK